MNNCGFKCKIHSKCIEKKNYTKTKLTKKTEY